ncbi:hypothetical protein EJB05_33508, partial [Eragrostis curvula]
MRMQHAMKYPSYPFWVGNLGFHTGNTHCRFMALQTYSSRMPKGRKLRAKMRSSRATCCATVVLRGTGAGCAPWVGDELAHASSHGWPGPTPTPSSHTRAATVAAAELIGAHQLATDSYHGGNANRGPPAPGFSTMFWRVLQHFGYMEPPMYVGRQIMDRGAPSCIIHVAIPATPAHPAWEPWTVSATGSEIRTTWGVAALKALTRFCEDHQNEMEGTPFALLPVNDRANPDWRHRMGMLLDVRHPQYNPYLVVPAYYSATLHALNCEQEEERSRYLEAIRLGNERDEAKDALLDMRDAQIVELALQVQNQDNQIAGLIEERDAAQQMVAQLMAAQVPHAPPEEQVPTDVINLQHGEQMEQLEPGRKSS